MSNYQPTALRVVLIRGDAALIGALSGAVAGMLAAPHWLRGRPGLAAGVTIAGILVGALIAVAVLRKRPAKYVYGAIFDKTGRWVTTTVIFASLILVVWRSQAVGPSSADLLRRDFAEKRVLAEAALDRADQALVALKNQLDVAIKAPDRPVAFNDAINFFGTYGEMLKREVTNRTLLSQAVVAFGAELAPSGSGTPFGQVARDIPATADQITSDAAAEVAKLVKELTISKSTEKPFDDRKLSELIDNLKESRKKLYELIIAADQKGLLTLAGDINTYGVSLDDKVHAVESAHADAKAEFDSSKNTKITLLEALKAKWEGTLQTLTGEAGGKIDAWKKQIETTPNPSPSVAVDTSAFLLQFQRGVVVIKRGTDLLESAARIQPSTLHDQIKTETDGWQTELKNSSDRYNAVRKKYQDSNGKDATAAEEISKNKPDELKTLVDVWDRRERELEKAIPRQFQVVNQPRGWDTFLPLRILEVLLGGSEHKKAVRAVADKLAGGVLPEQTAFDTAFRSAATTAEKLQEIDAYRMIAKEAVTTGKMSKADYDKFEERMANREQIALADWSTVVKNIYLLARNDPNATVDQLKQQLDSSIEQEGKVVKAYKSDPEKTQVQDALQILGLNAVDKFWDGGMSDVPVVK